MTRAHTGIVNSSIATKVELYTYCMHPQLCDISSVQLALE